MKTVEDYKKEIVDRLLGFTLEEEKKVKKRVPHGIFVNGKRVKVENGKVVWWQKNHASCALRNDVDKGCNISWNSYRGLDGKIDWDLLNNAKSSYYEAFEQLKKEGVIEIKPLENQEI